MLQNGKTPPADGLSGDESVKKPKPAGPKKKKKGKGKSKDRRTGADEGDQHGKAEMNGDVAAQSGLPAMPVVAGAKDGNSSAESSASSEDDDTSDNDSDAGKKAKAEDFLSQSAPEQQQQQQQKRVEAIKVKIPRNLTTTGAQSSSDSTSSGESSSDDDSDNDGSSDGEENDQAAPAFDPASLNEPLFPELKPPVTARKPHSAIQKRKESSSDDDEPLANFHRKQPAKREPETAEEELPKPVIGNSDSIKDGVSVCETSQVKDTTEEVKVDIETAVSAVQGSSPSGLDLAQTTSIEGTLAQIEMTCALIEGNADPSPSRNGGDEMEIGYTAGVQPDEKHEEMEIEQEKEESMVEETKTTEADVVTTDPKPEENKDRPSVFSVSSLLPQSTSPAPSEASVITAVSAPTTATTVGADHMDNIPQEDPGPAEPEKPEVPRATGSVDIVSESRLEEQASEVLEEPEQNPPVDSGTNDTAAEPAPVATPENKPSTPPIHEAPAENSVVADGGDDDDGDGEEDGTTGDGGGGEGDSGDAPGESAAVTNSTHVPAVPPLIPVAKTDRKPGG